MQHTLRRSLALVAGVAAAMTLVACANNDAATGEDADLTVSTSATPTVTKEETKEASTVKADSIYGEVVDEHAKLTYHFQGVNSGPYGGSEITVAVTNNNDAPLAPDALGEPALRYNAGNNDMQDASLLEVDVPEGADPIHTPLELPLGEGATTNLRYTFDVAPGNLWDAELRVGNVVWSGNLVG